MDGFFFGSTDYDEWYFEDVEMVRDWVRDTLIPEFDHIGSNEHIEFDTWW